MIQSRVVKAYEYGAVESKVKGSLQEDCASSLSEYSEDVSKVVVDNGRELNEFDLQNVVALFPNTDDEYDRGRLPDFHAQELKHRKKLLKMFNEGGNPEGASLQAAGFLSRAYIQTKCVAEFEKILTYKQAKETDPNLTAGKHFLENWKYYTDHFYAYTVTINEHDPTLLSDIRGFCRNRGIDYTTSDYYIPNLKDYNNHLLDNPELQSPEDAARLSSTALSRKREALKATTLSRTA